MSEFTVFGHRGAAGHAPENTLLSFTKALYMGVKWIETDVFNVEGELVVIHDERLERTTNGSGYVMQSSLEYLRSLDAGQGEKIPFLLEIMDLIDRRAGINIELKGEHTTEPTARLIEDYMTHKKWQPKQFLVSSFNHPELMKFMKLLPQIRIGALVAHIPLDYARFAVEMGAYSIHASLEFVSREFIDDTHRREMKFFVYTVNHPDDILRVKEMKVDGIYTDYPERSINV